MPVIVAPFLKPLEVDTATALLASNTMSLEFPVTGKILILYEACYHKQVGQLADAAAREVDEDWADSLADNPTMMVRVCWWRRT